MKALKNYKNWNSNKVALISLLVGSIVGFVIYILSVFNPEIRQTFGYDKPPEVVIKEKWDENKAKKIIRSQLQQWKNAPKSSEIPESQEISETDDVSEFSEISETEETSRINESNDLDTDNIAFYNVEYVDKSTIVGIAFSEGGGCHACKATLSLLNLSNKKMDGVKVLFR